MPGSGLSFAFPPSRHPMVSVDAGTGFHKEKVEVLVSLMYNRSCWCARAGQQCCSTCDGFMPPLGCHRDTAAGKALLLGKEVISHNLQLEDFRSLI